MRFRRKFLIYPKFQITLIILNLCILLGMIAAVSVAVHRSYAYLQNEGLAIGLSMDHPYFRFVELQSRVVYHSLFIAFVVGLIFSSLLTLLLSHRLVGPVVRLREFFKEVSAGAGRPLAFRKGDYFPDLPDIINRAIEYLKRPTN